MASYFCYAIAACAIAVFVNESRRRYRRHF